MKKFDGLNPLLHSQLRLAVVSILMSVESAEFVYIQEKTGATAGNLSVQINKLSKAGYLKVTKSFKNNKPLTSCKITQAGIAAFEEYVEKIQQYLKP
ncbi:winged helix-turn-helix domain-containing protein [Maribacter sp. 2307ULW6-5]|uniref:winged helix-turn-helix domain-containing protein n=1 Tax=Maribacter sp. 2307ULW6-5 TaxID=3386275 RepID=UPI0039BD6540